MSSCVIIPPKPRGGTGSGAHSHGTACFGGLRPELLNGSEIRYHSRHFRSHLEKSWFTGRGVPSMCDYSLHHVASRPAKVGDKLVTRSSTTRSRAVLPPWEAGYLVANSLDVSSLRKGRIHAPPSRTQLLYRGSRHTATFGSPS